MQSTNGTVEISDSLKEVINELNDPQTAAALKNLLKNAKTLDALLTGVDGFLRRGDEIADNVGESIREFVPAANGNGASAKFIEEVPALVGNLPALARTGNKIAKITENQDFDELLQAEKIAALKDLSNKLVNPITMSALNELIDNAPTFAFLAKALHDFLNRGEEIADNIGETLREFRPQMSGEYAANFATLVSHLPEALPTITENLPPLLEKAPILMQTTAKLGEIAESEGVQSFLNSGMLTPELVSLLGDIGKTTVKTEAEFRANPKPVSLFGLYGATKDDDVQRGIGFLIALAKNIGKMLKK
ncbi:MAG: DUF1641 domain-containing protein [Acidobacteria bacterium]|nr:DUF1641 domain-containing protein [Acidobacteriota bacterium]